MRSQMEDVRIRLSLEFELETRPKLIDVSALLYDLELLHDFTILVSSEEDYQTYKFSGTSGTEQADLLEKSKNFVR